MKTLEIRHILKLQFSEENLDQWFDPLKITIDASKITVLFPHTFFMKMFMKSYKECLEHAVAQCFDTNISIEYLVAPNGDTPASISTRIQPREPVQKNGKIFDFDSFLVNHKNQFPLASAQEVAAQKNTAYNPFVLYGKSGSGKTHLCKAILDALKKDVPTRNIFWGNAQELRKKIITIKGYESLVRSDILMVDDFQEIETDKDFQQAFLSLFNAFYEAGKQMILATSKRIQKMDLLEPCLKSRLGKGLMVTLKRPDLDIRLQFIKKACEKHHIQLSSEQMLTLARHFSDFRSLQGCLLKILAFQNLISPNMAQDDFFNIIKGLGSRTPTELTHETILAVVAEHLKVPTSAMLSATRRQDIVFARQAAMYLCRKLLRFSFPHIGIVFGGKDHSTVIYACRKIESLKARQQDIKNLLDLLTKKCRDASETPEVS